MLATRIPTLEESPTAMRAQGKMCVFQHSVAPEKGIESQAGCEDFLPPHGTGRGHKIDFAHSDERRLHVGIDGIADLEVVSSRLINRQQPQPAIPAPTTPAFWGEVLIRSAAD